jgi:hypothetical protein
MVIPASSSGLRSSGLATPRQGLQITGDPREIEWNLPCPDFSLLFGSDQPPGPKWYPERRSSALPPFWREVRCAVRRTGVVGSGAQRVRSRIYGTPQNQGESWAAQSVSEPVGTAIAQILHGFASVLVRWCPRQDSNLSCGTLTANHLPA